MAWGAGADGAAMAGAITVAWVVSGDRLGAWQVSIQSESSCLMSHTSP